MNRKERHDLMVATGFRLRDIPGGVTLWGRDHVVHDAGRRAADTLDEGRAVGATVRDLMPF